jgi:hypothetical protein
MRAPAVVEAVLNSTDGLAQSGSMRVPTAGFFVAAMLLSAYILFASCRPEEWRPDDLPPPPTTTTPQCPSAFARPSESAARLYSPEGYDDVASLSERGLSPLTQWTQAFIHRHQHPARCDRVLISDGHHSGFGSEMHVIGAHLAYAIQNNYVLVLSNKTCMHFRVPYACADGCACMLRPITNCTHFNASTPRLEGEVHMEERMVEALVTALRAQFPSMTTAEMKYWWRGQSAAYVMRFNNNTLRVMRSLRHNRTLHYTTHGCAVPFPLPANTISAHIRGGDKRFEMPLVSAQGFATAIFRLVQSMPHSFSRTVFVSGDDQRSIDEARQLIEARHMTVIYTRMPRLVGGHTMVEWKAAPDESEGSFYAHLLQLLMALEADAWVGTRGSNWNRLIDELRCVWVDKCQGVFVEVGQTPPQYSW